MNKRQWFALQNPLNSATGDISPYRTMRQIDKTLYVVVLAVDR